MFGSLWPRLSALNLMTPQHPGPEAIPRGRQTGALGGDPTAP